MLNYSSDCILRQLLVMRFDKLLALFVVNLMVYLHENKANQQLAFYCWNEQFEIKQYSSNQINMKLLSSTKNEKENQYNWNRTLGKFYPHNRRASQDDSISEIRKSGRYFQTIQHLSHFKKNSNKVECNIQQEKKDFLQAIKITRKKKSGLCQLQSQNWRRSEGVKTKSHTRNFTMVQMVYKPEHHESPSQIIRNNKIYPRYKVLQLHSLYQSILKYSEKNPKKFLQAFESSLNYQKIMIKPEIVKKHLYEQKKMDFKDFLLVYKKMEDLMFIQSIIDYLEIIFEVYSQEKMTHAMVLEILAKRSQFQLAHSITDLIFKSMGLQPDSTIELQQILALCEKDLQFCSKFSKVYQHEAH